MLVDSVVMISLLSVSLASCLHEDSDDIKKMLEEVLNELPEELKGEEIGGNFKVILCCRRSSSGTWREREIRDGRRPDATLPSPSVFEAEISVTRGS